MPKFVPPSQSTPINIWDLHKCCEIPALELTDKNAPSAKLFGAVAVDGPSDLMENTYGLAECWADLPEGAADRV